MRWRSRVSIFWRSRSEASIMIGLRISFHRFDYQPGCVFRREARGILRHLLLLVWMVDELPDLMRQGLGRHVRFVQNDRCVGAGEHFRVFRLVILGRVRSWYLDCRDRNGL